MSVCTPQQHLNQGFFSGMFFFLILDPWGWGWGGRSRGGEEVCWTSPSPPGSWVPCRIAAGGGVLALFFGAPPGWIGGPPPPGCKKKSCAQTVFPFDGGQTCISWGRQCTKQTACPTIDPPTQHLCDPPGRKGGGGRAGKTWVVLGESMYPTQPQKNSPAGGPGRWWTWI